MCDCTADQINEDTVGRIALESDGPDRVWYISTDNETVGSLVDNVLIPRAKFTVGDGFGNPSDIAVDDTYLYVATGGMWRIPKEGAYYEYGQNDPERIFLTTVSFFWLDSATNTAFWFRQPIFAGDWNLYSYDFDTLTETLLAESVATAYDNPNVTLGPDDLIWVASWPDAAPLIQRFQRNGTVVDSFPIVSTPEVIDDLVPNGDSVYIADTQGMIVRISPTSLEECVIEFPTWTVYPDDLQSGPPNKDFFGTNGLGSNGIDLAFSEEAGGG